MKIKIHFILPGGGVKGCFQAGFLYKLFKDYSDYFELYQIDGCSVGSLNGFGVASGNLSELKKNWLNITNSTDIFSPLSKIPFINGIVTAYSLFYKNGVYKNKLSSIVDSYKVQKNNQLEKFNCVVSNIRTGIYQYINGTNSKIKQKSSGFLMAVNQQLRRLLPPNLSTVEVPRCQSPRPAKLHFKLKDRQIP